MRVCAYCVYVYKMCKCAMCVCVCVQCENHRRAVVNGRRRRQEGSFSVSLRGRAG